MKLDMGSKEILAVTLSITFLGIFGLFSEVEATSFVLSDQTTCLALPATTAWIAASNICELSSGFTIGASDSLEIQSPASLKVISTGSLTNDGGTVTTSTGNMRVIGGSVTNQNSGTITINTFWDIRTGATITNDATSTIVNNNQIQFIGSTFTNAGTLTISPSGFLSVGNVGTFTNSGTLTNGGTISISGTFVNSGTLTNNNNIHVNCGTFTNTGTLTGNPEDIAFCFLGTINDKWSNPGNWNLNALPLSSSRILIGGSGPHLDIPFTLTGIISGNGLVIDPSGTFTNNGFVTLPSVFGVSLTNNGEYVNNAQIFTTSFISNTGTFTNNGIMKGNVLIQNSGTFTNSGTGQMTAGMDNSVSGVFNNLGTFDMNRSVNNNHGTFNNNAGTLNINNDLFNKNGATIVNSAIININHNLTFPGDLINEAGATITNNVDGTITITAATSSITNDGSIFTFGTFTNGGIITNNNFICGIITGNLVLGITPIGVCAETDTDGDGIPDLIDNCPFLNSPNQSDIDGDGIGDVCDADFDFISALLAQILSLLDNQVTCGAGTILVGNECLVDTTSTEKVTLCHEDKKTITISAEDVDDHLTHGDELGVCDE